MLRELGRFRTFDGAPLTSIAKRLASVDARDGRAVAATADVDPNYRLGDQLHVQPDARLEACFSADEPVRMTRQEVAVARSHIEARKVIATGQHEHVLVLEDDVWFTPRAAESINCGWRAALERCRKEGGPRLLYLSYEDAGETAERADPCDVSTAETNPATRRRKTRPVAGWQAPWRARSPDSWRVPWRIGPQGQSCDG
ncbi:MAG: hypothetical protein M5U35_11660 [Roseovarius sp.]|nr:hypothetical protein [Roseovarius sp.]